MAGQSIRRPENIAKLTKTSGTTLQLPASVVNVGAFQYNTAALTLNTAVVGIGGMADALAAMTTYYVYAVASSGTVYLVASTNNSLPTGYMQARKVGLTMTNQSSQIYQALYLGQQFVEYAYSTNTVTTAASTQTTDGLWDVGLTGTTFVSIDSVTNNSNTIKRARFQRAMQTTDVTTIEVFDGTGWWTPGVGSLDVINSVLQATGGVRTNYGMYFNWSTSTDILIRFGNNGRTCNPTTFGGAGSAWSEIAGTYFWRVKKLSLDII